MPETESLRSGPLTATPQRCSVAYLTMTECCGKLGKLSPAEQLCTPEPHKHPTQSFQQYSKKDSCWLKLHQVIAQCIYHTVQVCTEYGTHVLEIAVRPPAGDNASGSVQRCKVAFERNVAWVHLNSSPHALKGATASVIPALTLHAVDTLQQSMSQCYRLHSSKSLLLHICTFSDYLAAMHLITDWKVCLCCMSKCTYGGKRQLHTGEVHIPGLRGELCHSRMPGQAPQGQADRSVPHLSVQTTVKALDRLLERIYLHVRHILAC